MSDDGAGQKLNSKNVFLSCGRHEKSWRFSKETYKMTPLNLDITLLGGVELLWWLIRVEKRWS